MEIYSYSIIQYGPILLAFAYSIILFHSTLYTGCKYRKTVARGVQNSRQRKPTRFQFSMLADPRRVFSILVKNEDAMEKLLTFSYLAINDERVGVDLYSPGAGASASAASTLNATLSDASMISSSMASGSGAAASVISFDIDGNLRDPSKAQVVELIANLVASCLCLPDTVSSFLCFARLVHCTVQYNTSPLELERYFRYCNSN